MECKGTKRRAFPDEVALLIEEWVRGIEGERDPAGELGGFISERNGTATEVANLTTSKTEQSESCGEDPVTVHESQTLRCVEEKGSAAQVKSVPGGVIVSFSDDFGGMLVLRRCGSRGNRFEHVGTVAARGPQAPETAAYAKLGMPRSAGRAIEFVASWFGMPFDALLGGLGSKTFRWGFWRLSGKVLSACLATWKAWAPDRFDTLLLQYGIDVDQVKSTGGDVTDHELCVRAAGRITRGVQAEEIISRDARLVAALARVGREPAAQRAQIETLMRLSGAPALLQSASSSESSPLKLAKLSERLQAVLIYVSLRFGPKRGSQILYASQQLRANQSSEAWMLAIAEVCKLWGRTQESHQVIRIASSTELDAGGSYDEGSGQHPSEAEDGSSHGNAVFDSPIGTRGELSTSSEGAYPGGTSLPSGSS